MLGVMPSITNKQTNKQKLRDPIVADRDDLFQRFKNLSAEINNKDTEDLEQVPVVYKEDINTDVLNAAITSDEITKAVKGLKHNKSCGIDGIKNEHIKYSTHALMPWYLLLFNKVLRLIVGIFLRIGE